MFNPAVSDPLRALLQSTPQLAFSTAQPDLGATPFTPAPGPPDQGAFSALQTMLGQGGGGQAPPLTNNALQAILGGLGPSAASAMDLGGGEPPTSQPMPASTPTAGFDPFGGGTDPAVGPTVPDSGPDAAQVLRSRPTPPVMDPADFEPSGKTLAFEALLPAIGAIIAGLTGGGKMGAAGALAGANQANQITNQNIERSAQRKYQMSQQSYARDYSLWQDEHEQATQKATIIGNLADKARSFPNPSDGLAWLKAQQKLFTPLGINVMDAWGQAGVGADARRQEYIQGVLDKVVQRQLALVTASGEPMAPDFLASLPDRLNVRIDGVSKPMREWMTIAQSQPLELPTGATVSATKKAINAEIADSRETYLASTGQEPPPEMMLQFKKEAWEKHANDKKMADEYNKQKLENEKLQGQLTRANIARVNLANQGTSSGKHYTPKQEAWARSQMVLLSRDKVMQTFQTQGNLLDQFMATLDDPNPSGIDDLTLMAEFIRAKHPGSSRIGDTELLRLEQGRPGFENVGMLFQTLIGGQKLTPEQRQQMAAVLTRAYQGSKLMAESKLDDYGHIIERRGMDPWDVMAVTHWGSYHDPARGYWVRDEDAKNDAQAKQEEAAFHAAEEASSRAADIRAGRKPAPVAPDTSSVVNPLGKKARGEPLAPVVAPASPILILADGRRVRVVGMDAKGKALYEEVNADGSPKYR